MICSRLRNGNQIPCSSRQQIEIQSMNITGTFSRGNSNGGLRILWRCSNEPKDVEEKALYIKWNKKWRLKSNLYNRGLVWNNRWKQLKKQQRAHLRHCPPSWLQKNKKQKKPHSLSSSESKLSHTKSTQNLLESDETTVSMLVCMEGSGSGVMKNVIPRVVH